MKEKQSRERWESNPGLLGEKRQCYLCVMPPPQIKSGFSPLVWFNVVALLEIVALICISHFVLSDSREFEQLSGLPGPDVGVDDDDRRRAAFRRLADVRDAVVDVDVDVGVRSADIDPDQLSRTQPGRVLPDGFSSGWRPMPF